jgi:hypothetical protein
MLIAWNLFCTHHNSGDRQSEETVLRDLRWLRLTPNTLDANQRRVRWPQLTRKEQR